MGARGVTELPDSGIAIAAPPQRRARGISFRTQDMFLGYLFIFVPILIFLVFNFAGMIFDLWMSFQHWAILDSPRGVGWGNYNYIFNIDPVWKTAIQNTLGYVAIVVPIQTVIAFSLALVVNQNISGQKFFRTIFYFPSVTSSVAISLIFIFLFNKLGLINYLFTSIPSFTIPGVLYYLIRLIPAILMAAYLIRDPEVQAVRNLADVRLLSRSVWIVSGLLLLYLLDYFGAIPALLSTISFPDWISWIPGLFNFYVLRFPQHITPTAINWINDPNYILHVIEGQNIWTTTGTYMIVFLAALQDVPREVLEAGAIDGATGVQAVWRIVVPLIRPAMFFVIATGLIGTFQIFDQAFVYSQGGWGPDYATTTAVMYIYNNAFLNGYYGVAAAASFVLFAAIFVVTLAVRRLLPEE